MTVSITLGRHQWQYHAKHTACDDQHSKYLEYQEVWNNSLFEKLARRVNLIDFWSFFDDCHNV